MSNNEITQPATEETRKILWLTKAYFISGWMSLVFASTGLEMLTNPDDMWRFLDSHKEMAISVANAADTMKAVGLTENSIAIIFLGLAAASTSANFWLFDQTAHKIDDTDYTLY